MQRYVVTTAPKAWRDWIITIIISERENKACCLAWHYRAIILTPVKLRTSVIKVHACVLEHWLCQCRELDVQRRKGATSSHAHAHAQAKRDNPVVPFFFQRSFFCGYFHTICQTACETQRSHAESLTTEALCKPRPTLPTYAPPKCNSNADTRSTGWRHYVLPPPPALAVCPWSCSIFPDKYHPGQSIKDISLFLKHRMTLSLPLPHCYVMLRLSLSPISRSILFTSLHSRHATFASLAPLARLSHQAQRHWAILFVFVKLWHLSLVALYAVQRCTRRVGKLGWCTGLYPCAENMLSLNVA